MVPPHLRGSASLDSTDRVSWNTVVFIIEENPRMSGHVHFKPMWFRDQQYPTAFRPYGLWAVPGVLTPFTSGLGSRLRALPCGPTTHKSEKDQRRRHRMTSADFRKSESALQGTAQHSNRCAPREGRPVAVWLSSRGGVRYRRCRVYGCLVSERHFSC